MTEEIQDPIEEGTEPETEGTTPPAGHTCPHCIKRDEADQASEELNLAILIALVPALTITLFSNMGLF